MSFFSGGSVNEGDQDGYEDEDNQDDGQNYFRDGADGYGSDDMYEDAYESGPNDANYLAATDRGDGGGDGDGNGFDDQYPGQDGSQDSYYTEGYNEDEILQAQDDLPLSAQDDDKDEEATTEYEAETNLNTLRNRDESSRVEPTAILDADGETVAGTAKENSSISTLSSEISGTSTLPSVPALSVDTSSEMIDCNPKTAVEEVSYAKDREPSDSAGSIGALDPHAARTSTSGLGVTSKKNSPKSMGLVVQPLKNIDPQRSANIDHRTVAAARPNSFFTGVPPAETAKVTGDGNRKADSRPAEAAQGLRRRFESGFNPQNTVTNSRITGGQQQLQNANPQSRQLPPQFPRQPAVDRQNIDLSRLLNITPAVKVTRRAPEGAQTERTLSEKAQTTAEPLNNQQTFSNTGGREENTTLNVPVAKRPVTLRSTVDLSDANIITQQIRDSQKNIPPVSHNNPSVSERPPRPQEQTRNQEQTRKRPLNATEESDQTRSVDRNVSPRNAGAPRNGGVGGLRDSPQTFNPNPAPSMRESSVSTPTGSARHGNPSRGQSPRQSPVPSPRTNRHEITANALKGQNTKGVRGGSDPQGRFSAPSNRDSRDVEAQVDDILTRTSKRLREIQQDSGGGTGSMSETDDDVREGILINNSSREDEVEGSNERDRNVPTLVAALERDSYLLASALCRLMTNDALLLAPSLFKNGQELANIRDQLNTRKLAA